MEREFPWSDAQGINFEQPSKLLILYFHSPSDPVASEKRIEPSGKSVEAKGKNCNNTSLTIFLEESLMSTQPKEELNAEQLASISGGEGGGDGGDGGFRNETPGIGPKKGLLDDAELSTVSGGEDGGFRRENPGIGPKKGLLSDDDLSTVSGGEDGGFRRENPGIGPTEGLIK
jgi:hypothetical protein